MEQPKQNQVSICNNCGDKIVYQSGGWEHRQFINCGGGCLHPESVKIEESTHHLECRHAIGSHGRDYHMRCILLGKTGRSIKLLVFGERNWKGKELITQIRYLPENEESRLHKIEREDA